MPWVLRFQAIIFKEDIQNKLDYATCLSHILSKQAIILALFRGQSTHKALHTDVNILFLPKLTLSSGPRILKKNLAPDKHFWRKKSVRPKIKLDWP